ncbi:hypothetical protein FXO37_08517 [Capsicum annuum]|nr:hypothetical protein FXO37_08517 [Capsicum annuum]
MPQRRQDGISASFICLDLSVCTILFAGKVVVIRGEGPKGGPGMPEMLTPTSAIMGVGLGKDVALLTDGRFSGGSHGYVVGHICPEAQIVEYRARVQLDGKQVPNTYFVLQIL